MFVLQMQKNPERERSLLLGAPRSALSAISSLKDTSVFTSLFFVSSSLSCCFYPQKVVTTQQQLRWLVSERLYPPALRQILRTAIFQLPTILGFSHLKGPQKWISTHNNADNIVSDESFVQLIEESFAVHCRRCGRKV